MAAPAARLENNAGRVTSEDAAWAAAACALAGTGRLGRAEFTAARTSTMAMDESASSSSSSSSSSEEEEQEGRARDARPRALSVASLALEFEVPTAAVFQQVVEAYYARVASPEKDPAAKGREAVRLAAKQQQKLLRQHAPKITLEGAQQFAFMQVFALLKRKYSVDPLGVWRERDRQRDPQRKPAGEAALRIAVRSASVREQTMRAAAVAAARQAVAQSATAEGELAVVQAQIAAIHIDMQVQPADERI